MSRTSTTSTSTHFNPVTLGEGGGSTGWDLLEGPYVSDIVADYDFTEPCFVAG